MFVLEEKMPIMLYGKQIGELDFPDMVLQTKVTCEVSHQPNAGYQSRGFKVLLESTEADVDITAADVDITVLFPESWRKEAEEKFLEAVRNAGV